MLKTGGATPVTIPTTATAPLKGVGHDRRSRPGFAPDRCRGTWRYRPCRHPLAGMQQLFVILHDPITTSCSGQRGSELIAACIMPKVNRIPDRSNHFASLLPA
jgi:hypothetical protein